MNYSHFIVKITTKPEQSFFNNDIIHTEFVGKFYQFRDNKYTICKILVWGNLAYDIFRYYNINDFLIVEGYLSSQKSNFEDLNIQTSVQLSVCKLYPYAMKKARQKKTK
uniref:Uncharacterized protein n=1 Tax=Chaetoceros socialis TaxID=163503 RepID=A0A8F5J9F0_9STRA|nr:hypothetical protein Ycf41 [Chaetoceros socialis]